MNMQRFVEYLDSVLVPGGPIRAVHDFDDIGLKDKNGGRMVELTTGARIYLKYVGSYPDGGKANDLGQTGPVLPPVEVPPVDVASGSTSVRGFVDYLLALLVNGGSPEISGVTYSPARDEHSVMAINVSFYSTAKAHLLLMHMLRPGQQPVKDREYAHAERI
jgi:hypothetical protein